MSCLYLCQFWLDLSWKIPEEEHGGDEGAGWRGNKVMDIFWQSRLARKEQVGDLQHVRSQVTGCEIAEQQNLIIVIHVLNTNWFGA